MASNRVEAMDEFSEPLVDAFHIERAEAEAMLPRIWELEGQQKAIEQELGELKAKVKRALEQDAMPLVGELPNERRISASLKPRNKPASIDLISLARHPEHERHIVEAAQMGLLTASMTPLRAQKGRAACADALLAFEMPAGVNEILTIEVL